LENFVAGCLLKHVFGKIDYHAERYALHYLQTKERHEVDFALVKDDQIEKLIEVKKSDPSLTKGLLYFHEKYNLPAVQVVRHLKRERMEGKVEVVEIDRFLKSLFL
jgi:hypothetical protein